MTDTTQVHDDMAPLVACTISRDVQNFDLLIEDMEAQLGETWGDLTFEDARQFFRQPESSELKFVAVALDKDDEASLPIITDLFNLAKKQRVKIILIADNLSPMVLHQLLQLGAEDFIPYPLPENALKDAIARLNQPKKANISEFLDATDDARPSRKRGAQGIILPIQSISGGAGATTVAVNLAWELANINPKGVQPRVLLMDLNLQYGTVATYLDLPRREAVFELLSDTDLLDDDLFKGALMSFNDKLSVLTSPPEILPLDFINGTDVTRLLDYARKHFDYIVIDMPMTLVAWTETVLNTAAFYFAPFELDLRSAQNIMRLRNALKAEELPFEKFRFLLNRIAKTMDMTAKSRAKRLAENLDIAIDVQLPDGGRAVRDACDQGLPLAIEAAKNPLRKEIQKLATSIHARQAEALEAAE